MRRDRNNSEFVYALQFLLESDRARSRLLRGVEESVLSIPPFDARVGHDLGADYVEALHPALPEGAVPHRVPLLIHVVRPALSRYRRREQHVWRLERQGLDHP